MVHQRNCIITTNVSYPGPLATSRGLLSLLVSFSLRGYRAARCFQPFSLYFVLPQPESFLSEKLSSSVGRGLRHISVWSTHANEYSRGAKLLRVNATIAGFLGKHWKPVIKRFLAKQGKLLLISIRHAHSADLLCDLNARLHVSFLWRATNC